MIDPKKRISKLRILFIQERNILSLSNKEGGGEEFLLILLINKASLFR